MISVVKPFSNQFSRDNKKDFGGNKKWFFNMLPWIRKITLELENGEDIARLCNKTRHEAFFSSVSHWTAKRDLRGCSLTKNESTYEDDIYFREGGRKLGRSQLSIALTYFAETTNTSKSVCNPQNILGEGERKPQVLIRTAEFFHYQPKPRAKILRIYDFALKSLDFLSLKGSENEEKFTQSSPSLNEKYPN
ncbi:hypothetical protein ACFE04_019790 [Oxalis oulophora]